MISQEWRENTRDVRSTDFSSFLVKNPGSAVASPWVELVLGPKRFVSPHVPVSDPVDIVITHTLKCANKYKSSPSHANLCHSIKILHALISENVEEKSGK